MKSQEKRQIFREKSLEQLFSPRDLEHIIEVIDRRDWLPLFTTGVLTSIAILWSIFGKIPVNVASKGVLVPGSGITDLESPVVGQLSKLNVSVGDCVEKDQVIATIDPSDIKQKLSQERDKYQQLIQQERVAKTISTQRTNLDILSIQKQIQTKQQRLEYIKAVNPKFKDKEIRAIEQQKVSLSQQERDGLTMDSLLKERLQKLNSLQKQGAISKEQTLQARQEYVQNSQNLTKIKSDFEMLNVRQIEVEKKYLDNLNTISQLEAEIQEAFSQLKRLEQENNDAATKRNNEIQQVKFNIAQFEKQLLDNSQIKSPQAGCILELTSNNGSVIDLGERIATIEPSNSNSQIQAIAYFPVADGKKIERGMKIYVTPDTVNRSRYGGIIGEVSKISKYPITKLGAARIAGNPELVEQLVSSNGSVIEVKAILKRDPETSSGYKWSSSKGPARLGISSGTTISARVTISEVAPITLVLPILKEWSGI
ncbi:MAG: NHLP bacteriocin system secretion protein [Prochloraceae cyanobacterium]